MPTLEERFWAKVDKDGPVPEHRPELGPCWLWTGARDRYGYGQISVAGKLKLAHRTSLTLAGLPLRDDQLAMHECDNPPCVNPGHVHADSHQANTRDMVAKGRGGNQAHPERAARGEQQGLARLTEEQVRQIRVAYATGMTSLSSEARRFGVAKRTILDVVQRRTWRHVE
jgi:hypothetical protein